MGRVSYLPAAFFLAAMSLLSANGLGDPAAVGSAIAPFLLDATGQWKLIFSDEFDGDSLDRQKWVTCYWWNNGGCTNLANRELQWYQPANVSIVDGYLRLRAQREKAKGVFGKTFLYTSGLASTGRDVDDIEQPIRFEFLYGFAEIRAKVPAGRGLHPAFWMLPSTHQENPEIDIMEVVGQRPNVLYTYLHYLDPADMEQKIGGPTETSDLSADWAVFGLDWQPDRVVWYLNGKEVRRSAVPSQIPAEPMYLLLNLAVGGNWPKSPDEATHFPADLLIDYVRVWKPIN